MRSYFFYKFLIILFRTFGGFFSFLVTAALTIFPGIIFYLIISPKGILLIILIFLLIFFISFFIYHLFKIKTYYENLFEIIIDILSNDLKKKAGHIHERPGRIPPDIPLTNFRLYSDVLATIKSNGYIELFCVDMGLGLAKKQDLTLHTVSPGMNQYFMILRPINSDYNESYLRIYNGNISIDDRDFAHTWFHDIFPILGNFSETISEKMDGSPIRDISGEHFIINKYKLSSTKSLQKKKLISMKIFL